MFVVILYKHVPSLDPRPHFTRDEGLHVFIPTNLISHALIILQKGCCFASQKSFLKSLV